jgi:peptidoglycan/xylan/chitin deacetylase (PgdA/CDA1 family)
LTAVHTVSFDNLGEVTELARGEFPAGEPLGRHFSVTRALPRILALLASAGVRTTFFVEGLNTELYPDTLAGIAEAGHEVGYHGWCHETWGELERDEEAKLLERGVRALDALGLPPAGFRPPGGELTASTLPLLRELGFSYCSPAGGEPRSQDGIAILPFAWPLVDAYHYLPRFAELRGGDDPRSPAAFEAALGETGDERCVIFHPFLTVEEERLGVLARFVAARGDSGPCREAAARVSAAGRA